MQALARDRSTRRAQLQRSLNELLRDLQSRRDHQGGSGADRNVSSPGPAPSLESPNTTSSLQDPIHLPGTDRSSAHLAHQGGRS